MEKYTDDKYFEIEGVDVFVTTENNDEYFEKEIEGYVKRGLKEYGHHLQKLTIQINGGDVDIDYVLREPFERIRRITGYLVGTTDRFNNAKQSEEHDRVKHGLE